MALATGEGSSSRSDLTIDVQYAVLRLKELGSHMRDSSHHFLEQDLEKIDELVHYLRELDSKRVKVHENLEALTITNSVTRHKLAVFPGKTAKEVEERVQQARDLNAEQITALEATVADIEERMSQTLRTQDLLDMHNGLLESEQKKLSESHSVLVKRLNVRMAERARVQIELNEASKKFKDAVQKMNSVKRDIHEVEESMQKVVKTFTGKMHSLTKMLEDVQDQQQQKAEENKCLKKKLNELKYEITEHELIAQDKHTIFNKSETAIKSLVDSEASMKSELVEGAEEIVKLKEQRGNAEREAEAVKDEYQLKSKEIAEKRDQLQQHRSVLEAETDKLTTLCRGLKRELKNVSDDASMQDEVLRDIKEKIAETKATLLKHAEEGVQLSEEHDMLVKNLKELQLSHQDTVSALTNQISEFQKRLQQNTRTKECMQSGFDEITQTIEAKTVCHKEAIASMQTQLTGGKELSESLSERIISLEAATEQCCGETVVCDGQLKGADQKLTKRKKSLTSAVNLLEENVADLRGEIADRDETLSRIGPQCVTLEREHRERNEAYENEKKELIALKSKKSEMQDRIKEVQRTLEKMQIPREKLKRDTLRCRAYTRQEVVQRTADVDELEKQVTHASQKVRVIQKENERIIENSQLVSQEISRMRSVLSRSKEMEDQLDTALRLYKCKLAEQQRVNGELEKETSSRDRLVLKDIVELKESSANRHQIISTLHEQFQEESKGFSDYLHATANMAF